MHSPSFARKDRGIVIDADIRFSFGFILEQFPPGNKAIEEEMCKIVNRGRNQCCSGSVSLYFDNQSLSTIYQCAVASFSLNEPLFVEDNRWIQALSHLILARVAFRSFRAISPRFYRKRTTAQSCINQTKRAARFR
jgi:hypothetical protein